MHWQVILGILPEKRIKRKVSKEVRKELRKLERISRETMILFKNNITNLEQLHEYRCKVESQYKELIELRKDCYYQRKQANDFDENIWSEKAKTLTPEIKKLRFKLKCIDEIEEKSIRFEKQLNDLEKINDRQLG